MAPSRSDKPSGKQEAKPTVNGNGVSEEPNTTEEQVPKVRASKLEYKTVNQIFDKKNYGHKIVELVGNEDDEDAYEEYIFVERRKYDDRNMHYKTFLDIKSEPLRDVLRKVLSGSPISFRGDKPEIYVDTLYFYLPRLEAQQLESEEDMKHVKLLTRFLRTHFDSTIKTLPELFKHGEITFDLLWALFPPLSIVYSVDENSDQRQCTIVDSCEEKVSLMAGKYLSLNVHRINFDGKVFGEVMDSIPISEFSGVKPIDSLDAFPLRYHKEKAEIKSALIDRGRLFVSLSGVHHRAYNGLAHVKRDRQKTFKFSVKGRFMIDPLSFREHNPNYASPEIRGIVRRVRPNTMRSLDGLTDDFVEDRTLEDSSHAQIGFKPDNLTEEELLICSPTVLGFSLEKRIWAEFAVSCIGEIRWTTLPFDTLVIPEKKKNLLQALVQDHTADPEKASFDDVVEGKGKGLIILLHGPPGVGKTLTAEAISEHRHRPLYRVTAGDLGLDSEKLEDSLTEAFELVACWKAILLLDEADVFLEARERQHLHHNTLVSVFLRQLEYLQGIMILTTNRVTAFDDAVQSRVHLGIKYETLRSKAKEEIWVTFINQANKARVDCKEMAINARDMSYLAGQDFNGRQIKNTVRMACALATAEDRSLQFSDLRDAIEANADFDNDFRGGGGHRDAMKAYQ